MKEPPSKYHQILKEVLEEFSLENKQKLSRTRGSFKITSDKKRAKEMVEYDPDFAFKLKAGKKGFEYIIIEFLDKQPQEGVIADIVECAAIENCRLLIFLSKTEKKHLKAINAIEVIGDFLNKIHGDKLLDIGAHHIPMKMDKEEIKDVIYKEINKSVKLPKQPFILGKSRLGGRGTLS